MSEVEKTRSPTMENTTEDVPLVVGEKKKKKKSKSKKKAPSAPTGFEDNFAEAPLTVEEHNEETELYSPARTLSSRVEAAVQRFMDRRKFDGERNQLFTRYCNYGGINRGHKMFQGVGREIEEDPQGDSLTLKAKEFVSNNVYEDEIRGLEEEQELMYVVDFEGVTRSFFSVYLPGSMSMQTEDRVKNYTGVIRNWLNYLLHHNVCDEYREQILAARGCCAVAESELWQLENLQGLLPGQFNEACAVLYTPSQPGSAEDCWDWNDILIEFRSLNREESERVFLTALAGMGSEELIESYQKHNATGIEIIDSYETGLEITVIEQPTEAIRNLYSDASSHGLLPLGKIRARTWHSEGGPPQDLMEEEEEELRKGKVLNQREYEFWIDEKALKYLFVGLKARVYLKQLNFGIFFVDKWLHTYCSFVTWLPNEMMQGWKEHEWIPPDRDKLMEKLERFRLENQGKRVDYPDDNINRHDY